MANRRIISKSISTSRKLSRVSYLAALLFTWIIPHADDGGNMDGDWQIVAATVVPLMPCTGEEVEQALTELEHVGLITFYVSVFGNLCHVGHAKKCHLLRSSSTSFLQRYGRVMVCLLSLRSSPQPSCPSNWPACGDRATKVARCGGPRRRGPCEGIDHKARRSMAAWGHFDQHAAGVLS